jgi:hypothetical protein
MMTENEKIALIRYMNFQFTKYVETFARHVPEDVLQAMYDEAYKMLNDLHLTLDMDMALKVPPHKHTPQKKI